MSKQFCFVLKAAFVTRLSAPVSSHKEAEGGRKGGKGGKRKNVGGGACLILPMMAKYVDIQHRVGVSETHPSIRHPHARASRFSLIFDAHTSSSAIFASDTSTRTVPLSVTMT